METLSRSCRWKRGTLTAAIVLSLVLSGTIQAASARKKSSSRRSAVKVRPTPTPLPTPVPTPAYPAYLGIDHFWYPRYAANHPAWAWDCIGYPYHFKGIDYAAVPDPTEPTAGQTTPDKKSAAKKDPAETRYRELRLLTDLVHQWRTLNEAPAFHDRISPGLITDDDAKAAFETIKRENQKFDQAARSAMHRLSRAESAAADLAALRNTLNQLTDILDALPQPKNQTTIKTPKKD